MTSYARELISLHLDEASQLVERPVNFNLRSNLLDTYWLNTQMLHLLPDVHEN